MSGGSSNHGLVAARFGVQPVAVNHQLTQSLVPPNGRSQGGALAYWTLHPALRYGEGDHVIRHRSGRGPRPGHSYASGVVCGGPARSEADVWRTEGGLGWAPGQEVVVLGRQLHPTCNLAAGNSPSHYRCSESGSITTSLFAS